MASAFIKYLFLIGCISVFEIADAAKTIPPDDKIKFNSSGLNPEVDVKFFLYTQSYPDNSKQLFVGDTNTLSKTGFNAKKPTKFLVHGWKYPGGDDAECHTPIRKAFLKDDVNVIIVEWKRVATELEYPDAAKKALAIAQYFSKMIDFLVDQGANPRFMTIAGHSTGAHIAGLASRNAKKQVGHIVGMDPGGPGFGGQDQNGRLSVVDAHFVETIHVNSDLLGIDKVIGRVDYYPNGGGSQPGCENIQGKNKKETAMNRGWCSHIRSCLYYAESIKQPNKWLARKCDSYEQFKNGQCNHEQIVEFARSKAIPRPDGKYYLRTDGKNGLGLKGVESSDQ